MADPDAVKRALSRLAAGHPLSHGRQQGPDSHYERVVQEATEAVEDLDRAVTFREDGGFARLRQAVAAAERAGDRSLARRGQRALAAYERFARATTASGPPAAEGRTDECDGRSPSSRSGSSRRQSRSRNQ